MESFTGMKHYFHFKFHILLLLLALISNLSEALVKVSDNNSNNNNDALECQDDDSFSMPVDRPEPVEKDCSWVEENRGRCQFPHKRSTIGTIFCPVTCDLCDKHRLPNCSDASRFLSRTRFKDCSWVAENVSERCSMIYMNRKVERYCPRTCNACPSSVPSSVPSLNPTICSDDSFFSGTIQINEMKDCSWVNEDKANRCNIPHKSRTIGSIFCPVTCNACSELNVYGCIDTDRVMIRTQTINCEWVARDLSSRCSMEYGNVMIGDVYCPQTCGHCESRKFPSSSPSNLPTNTDYPSMVPSQQPSSCLHLFEFNLKTDNDPQNFYWELVDSNYNIIPRNENNIYERVLKYESNTDYYHRQCINTNECITLRLFDYFRNGGIQYEVSWDGVEVKNSTTSGVLEKIRMGVNCDQPYCAPGQLLFELDLGTDGYPEDLGWELEKPNGEILASKSIGYYTEMNTYYYYGKCFSITDEECKTLTVDDSYGDGGTVYSVSWNGNLYQNGSVVNEFQRTERFGAECNPCSADNSYFELSVNTSQSPTTFSWELSNSYEQIIASKNDYSTPSQTHQFTQCVSATRDSCALLRLTETSGSDWTEYSVSWNLLQDHQSVQSKPNETIPLGSNCQQLLCTDTEELFELILTTDLYPTDLSWTLLDSTNNIMIDTGNDYSGYYEIEHIYHYYCVPKNICLSFNLEDDYGDGGTTYSLRLNGNIQASGTQPNPSFIQIITIGNCVAER